MANRIPEVLKLNNFIAAPFNSSAEFNQYFWKRLNSVETQTATLTNRRCEFRPLTVAL